MISNNSSTIEQGKKPLVSVIMNCYNGEKYLKEAINSLLAQTYQNWEVVFWDNQSTDRSAEIFKSYKDERMKYFYAPVCTVLGRGRNMAIEQATGEWLGFLDCDDMWLPKKLEKQVAIINNNGPELGLVYSGAEYVIEKEGEATVWGSKLTKFQHKERTQYLPSGYIFPAMLKENLVPLVSALVLRSAFVKVGGISADFKQAEDYELFVKITKFYEAVAIPDATCIFRIHQSNWSHSQSEESYTESLAVVERYLPQPDAIAGARIWQANYAGYLFMNRRYADGLAQLVRSRNYLFFFKKIFSRAVNSLQTVLSR